MKTIHLIWLMSLFVSAYCLDIIIYTDKEWTVGQQHTLTFEFRHAKNEHVYSLRGCSFQPLISIDGEDIQDPSRRVISLTLPSVIRPEEGFVNVKVNLKKAGRYNVLVHTDGGDFTPINPIINAVAFESGSASTSTASSVSVRKADYFENLFFGQVSHENIISGRYSDGQYQEFRRLLTELYDINSNSPTRDYHISQIELGQNNIAIPRSLLTLNGKEYLDDEVIFVAFRYWFDNVATGEYKNNFVLVNPAYRMGLPQDNWILVRSQFREHSAKRYFIFPFNSGPGAHWYLIIYDQHLNDYFVVDSLLSREREKYHYSVALFAYILKNYIGVDFHEIPVPCDMDIVGEAHSRHLRCKNILDKTIPDRINYWYGSSKQRDGYNCGVLTLLNSMEIVSNEILLETVRVNGVRETSKYTIKELDTARRTLFIELSSKCYDGQVFDFPQCFGYVDNAVDNF